MRISFRKLSDLEDMFQQEDEIQEKRDIQVGDTIIYEAIVNNGTKTRMKVILDSEVDVRLKGEKHPGFWGSILKIYDTVKDGEYGPAAWEVGNHVQILRSELDQIQKILVKGDRRTEVYVHLDDIDNHGVGHGCDDCDINGKSYGVGIFKPTSPEEAEERVYAISEGQAIIKAKRRALEMGYKLIPMPE